MSYIYYFMYNKISNFVLLILKVYKMGKRHDQSIYDKLSIEYIINKKSLTEIAKESGIDRRTLSTNFKRMGIEIINIQNSTKFDENVFDEIDTEEKAYWLGFIYADGYISSTRNSFELSLALKDINHLIKFNLFMKHSKNNVKFDTIRCRWSVVNKHLWNTLNNYGCVPKKSLILEFPNENIFKSKDLIRHFIRGYFDGDGCITYQQRGEGKVYCVVSLLGTPKFLDKLEEYLQFENKITRSHDKRHSEQTVNFSFKRSESTKLINLLYNDSTIYLDRKYKLFNFFKNGCRSLEEFNELLQTNIGEGCDANTEINLDSNKSKSSYSVEIETKILE